MQIQTIMTRKISDRSDLAGAGLSIVYADKWVQDSTISCLTKCIRLMFCSYRKLQAPIGSKCMRTRLMLVSVFFCVVLHCLHATYRSTSTSLENMT